MDSALVQELLLHHDSIRSKVHLAVVDPELLPGSGYGIIVQQIQQNRKEQINKNVITLLILDFVYCRTVA